MVCLLGCCNVVISHGAPEPTLELKPPHPFSHSRPQSRGMLTRVYRPRQYHPPQNRKKFSSDTTASPFPNT